MQEARKQKHFLGWWHFGGVTFFFCWGIFLLSQKAPLVSRFQERQESGIFGPEDAALIHEEKAEP